MQKYTIAGIIAVILAITYIGANVLPLDISAIGRGSQYLPQGNQTPHPFTIEDLVTLQRIGTPSPSPDGSWVAFTLRSTDTAVTRERTNLSTSLIF